MSSSKILLQVSGSISAFKAVALCSKLVQAQYEVEVIMSEDAKNFIGPASFEGLTRKKVHRGNFEVGTMMAHIDLERWADLILLYPATANSLSSLAHGRGDSLIGSLFLAHQFKKPYWIAPAMNTAMWEHPATQENCKILQNWGLKLILPQEGFLACGEIGAGRLAEPEDVFKKIEAHFSETHFADNKDLSLAKNPISKKILITAGGTSEPIDAIRSISNFSTGQTGYQLAMTLQKQGYDVTLLQARASKFSEGISQLISYDTTENFAQSLESELKSKNYDYLIHSAAVADFSVESISNLRGVVLAQNTKIQANEELLIRLRPNPKLIQKVRTWSKNKNLKVISFKLTFDEKNDLKLDTYDSEWIVHNFLKDVSPASNPTLHIGTVFKKQKNGTHVPVSQFKTNSELNRLITTMIGDPS